MACKQGRKSKQNQQGMRRRRVPFFMQQEIAPQTVRRAPNDLRLQRGSEVGAVIDRFFMPYSCLIHAFSMIPPWFSVYFSSY